SQIPWVRPVIDYWNVLNYPVFGGEVSYRTNFTSLQRDRAAFDAVTSAAYNTGTCLPTSADPGARTPDKCLLRGAPGDYTRASAEVSWRKSFTDRFGQIWTPFASLRADVISTNISDQPGVSNHIRPGETGVARVMPT